MDKARKNMDVQGFYFFDNPVEGDEYGSVTYDVFLKMKKPYIVDSREKQQAIPFDMSKEGAGITAREWLQSQGYDSVISKAEYYGAGADEYIVFNSNQVKSAEPATYRDDEYGEGDIIPLSERFNARKKDIRWNKIGKNNDSSVDKTVKNSYNESRWAVDRGIISPALYERFESANTMMRSGQEHRPQTDDGQYIIAIGEESGINNILIFIDGKEKPSIERVVEILLDNETDIEKVRDYIYGKEISKWSRKSDDVTEVYGEDVFRRYLFTDSPNISRKDTGTERNSREKNKPDNRQLQNRARGYGQSETALTGYKGESRYNYYDEQNKGYYVELADGQRKRFYVPPQHSKDKRYRTTSGSFATIEELVMAENAKIIGASNDASFNLQPTDKDKSKAKSTLQAINAGKMTPAKVQNDVNKDLVSYDSHITVDNTTGNVVIKKSIISLNESKENNQLVKVKALLMEQGYTDKQADEAIGKMFEIAEYQQAVKPELYFEPDRFYDYIKTNSDYGFSADATTTLIFLYLSMKK